jgi:putative transcriptional regulator
MTQLPLRRIRRERDWTQEELAAKAGCSQQTIASLEKGRMKNPSARTALAIAHALDRSVEELFPDLAPARTPSEQEAVAS